MRHCLLLLSLFLTSACTAKDSLELSKCNSPTLLSVSEQRFNLPTEKVLSIEVLNTDKASAFVTFKHNWLPDLHIITTNENQITGGIQRRGGYEKLGVASLSGLFQKAKSDNNNTSDYEEKVYEAMGLDKPENIQLLHSKNELIVTVKDSYQDGADVIYILRNQDERILMLVAHMEERQVDLLISSICQ